ncbi:hypothetical protein [Bacteroides heparinolyticus]|uniref:hypothetical protein n=1 Tax=Prevotella heparinolytica TaxID=28113 RepID=UPI00359F3765
MCLTLCLGCSKEEPTTRRIYPEKPQKPIELSAFKGSMKYHNELEKWVIYTEIEQGDEVTDVLMIENMKDEYKVYENQRIVFSGTAQHLYTDVIWPINGAVTIYYSLKLKDIKLNEDASNISH